MSTLDPKNTQSPEESVFLDSVGDNKGKRQALEVTEDAREKEYKQPSFGGQLFMGNFNEKLLFPFPEQSEEERKIGQEFTDKLMDYLSKNMDPEEVDATREIPKHVIAEMAKMGVFALKVPKEYGGLGFSHTNFCRLVMRVGSFCGSTGALITAHQSIGVPQPVRLYGTEEQKRKFLPMFRQGKISAFALTDPDAGSDPAQMSAEAVLSPDGSHYILNGTKLWCTNGTIADIIVVMAKTAPKIVKGKEKKQISAFILEMNTPGVKVVHRCEFMGLGALYNGLLTFTNVKIPKENLLWEEGRGLAIALGTINVGRLSLPAGSTGAAKQCLAIARRWGASRVQWGLPVGLHEEGKSKLAYIAATTFAMEAITWLCSYWADQGKVDIRIEAAMAKLFTTESMWKIVDLTMQLRGGRGYEKGRSLAARGEVPYAVERIMRDCRVNTILEGSSEIMKLFLAREAMDPHLKMASPLLSKKTSMFEKVKTAFKLAGFYSLWYPRQKLAGISKGSYPELKSLETHFQFVNTHSHKMAASLFQAMAKYREELVQKQMVLGRLMEIGTDLLAIAATCSFAQQAIEKNPKDETPIALADYFCWIARRRIDERFAALHDNDDNKTNVIGEKVINKDFRWLEKGIQWMGPDE